MSHKFKKKTGLQIKIMKGAKDLDIGTEKKERVAKKNFLPGKNFVSVEKYESVEPHDLSGPSYICKPRKGL